MAASNLQTKNHAFQPVFMAPVLPILYPDVAFSFFVIIQKKIHQHLGQHSKEVLTHPTAARLPET
jgi:hypothetical protein